MSKLQLNAVQTAAMLAVLTLISKCIGFFREMIMANFYGTSYIADAYQMAVAIPGMILGGIFGAISVAYTPLFSKKMEEEGLDAGNRYTSAIINILLIAGLCSALIGICFSDDFVSVIAHGFTGEKAALTVFYLRISFIFVIFTSISGILDAYLRYRGSFLTPVIAGYLQNAGMISIIILSAYTSHYYLIFGLLLGYILNLGMQVIFVHKKQFRYAPVLRSEHIAKQIAKLSIPIFIGSGGAQLNAIIDKTLASGLPDGRVAALNYGMLLVSLVAGLTVSIFTTMVYPKLAQAVATQDYGRMSDLLGLGVVLITLIAAPCTLGGMIYAGQIVQAVYERGAFDPHSTGITAAAFFYYLPSLAFGAISTLFVYCFYSLHDTKTPIIGGLAGVVVNITLNLILIRPMEHGGLALSTSIASLCNVIILYLMLRKKHPAITILKSRRKILKINGAAILAVSASWGAYHFLIMPFSDILYPRMLQLGLAVFTAAVVYYVLLALWKIEEVKLIKLLVWKGK